MRRVLVIISLLLVTQLLNAQALHRYVNTTEPCLHILQGHTSRVNSAAFNPDGKRIVSASNDNTIRIWDAMTGECLQILEGHGNNVNSALFSPDGRSIVSASQDENVRIWDAVTGRCRKTLWSSQKGDINVITASFSPDGKRVVWAEFPRYQLYNDADNLICIWDTVTGQCVKAIYLSQKDDIDVMTASFSPDGKRIVSAERPADMYSQADNIIRIWDSTTGRCLHTIKGHIGYINSASYSPNGKYIVSASNDSTIRIWDSETGQQIGRPMKGHTKSVNAASFSPDGKYIVSASRDMTVRIWNADTGQQIGLPMIGHTSSVNSAVFSPDGKHIVSASDDKTIRIWDFLLPSKN